MSNMSNTKGKICCSIVVKLFVLFLCFLPSKILAQVLVPNDIPTIEAYINDHKTQRSLLLARSTLEVGNGALHKASEAMNQEYQGINIDLDKYTRAFDIIDLVYNAVSTGFNVYRTYEDVSEKIAKYKDMLSDYHDLILSRHRVETADSLLFMVNDRAIRHLADEVQNLYSSVCLLAAYSTGQICCTTATMMQMINSIDASLDRILQIVNSAYYQTWKFIQARTRLWKGQLYRSRTMREVVDDAFGRWMEAGNVLNY